MTPKQKIFCQEYAACGVGSQAAIKAGYSEKNARRIAYNLLKQPAIQEELKRITDEIKSSKIMQASEIQETLTAMIRGESVEDVIVTEMTGDGTSKAVTVQKTASNADKIKAAQLLARMQGSLDYDVNVNGVLPVVITGEDELDDDTEGGKYCGVNARS